MVSTLSWSLLFLLVSCLSFLLDLYTVAALDTNFFASFGFRKPNILGFQCRLYKADACPPLLFSVHRRAPSLLQSLDRFTVMEGSDVLHATDVNEAEWDIELHGRYARTWREAAFGSYFCRGWQFLTKECFSLKRSVSYRAWEFEISIYEDNMIELDKLNLQTYILGMMRGMQRLILAKKIGLELR
jgi:hypothetical protein